MIFLQASQGTMAGTQMLGLALIFLIFYLFIIRPQSKRQNEHKAMIESLKKGSRIITTGGLHGVIMDVREKTILLKIAEKVYVEVEKANVSARLSQGKPEETNNAG